MPSEMKCAVSELDKLSIAVIFDRQVFVSLIEPGSRPISHLIGYQADEQPCETPEGRKEAPQS